MITSVTPLGLTCITFSPAGQTIAVDSLTVTTGVLRMHRQNQYARFAVDRVCSGASELSVDGLPQFNASHGESE